MQNLFLQLMATTPLLVTLIVGLVICYRYRRKRPRAARMLAWGLAAQLIWSSAGIRIYMSLVVPFMRNRIQFDREAFPTLWLANQSLIGLIPATISAIIWGLALWAVLMIDDWQIDTPSDSQRLEN